MSVVQTGVLGNAVVRDHQGAKLGWTSRVVSGGVACHMRRGSCKGFLQMASFKFLLRPKAQWLCPITESRFHAQELRSLRS